MNTTIAPLGHTQTVLVSPDQLFPDLERRELFETATDLIVNLEQDEHWDGSTRHLDLVTGTMSLADAKLAFKSVTTWCDTLGLTFIPVPMGGGKWLLGISRREVFPA